MDFKSAMRFVMTWEGGYVDDPLDPGGETKYGISKRAHPDVNIVNLTIQQAQGIYRKNYWDAVRIDCLPAYMRLLVFDFAVNSGPETATKKMQKVFNVDPDGAIGKITLSASHNTPPNLFLYEYAAARIMFLSRLPKFSRYGTGWTRRVCDALVHSLLNVSNLSLTEMPRFP